MAYDRINWQNEPSEATALNDVNLNKMDSAIYDHDQRLDTAESDIGDIESDVTTAQGDITDLQGDMTTAQGDITALQNGKVDKESGKGLSTISAIGVTTYTNQGGTICDFVAIDQSGSTYHNYIKNGVNIDSALSSMSQNPVENRVVKNAIDNKVDKESGKGLSQVDNVSISSTTSAGTKIGEITVSGVGGSAVGTNLYNGVTVDSALSNESENPVQNKVISEAFRDILPEETATGNPITITDGVKLPATACKVTMLPIQDLSHGDPSPTNICPISGRDSVTVTRTGKNVWGGTAVRDGILNAMSSATSTDDTVTFAASQTNTRAFSDGVKFKENTQYTIIFTGVNSATPRTNFRVSYTDGTSQNFGDFGTSKSTIVVTTNANKSVDRVTKTNSGGNTTLYFKECGMFEGVLTADDFEPYTAETHTVTFSNTVYGAKYDFTTGKLIVDRVIQICDGSSEESGQYAWTAYGSNGYYLNRPLMLPSRYYNGKSNWLRTVSGTSEFGVAIGINNRNIYALHINDTLTEVSDLTTWKSYLSTHNLQVEYPLENPTEIQLSPEALTLLKSMNVISTDGDNLEVKYSADIKAYIDDKLAQMLPS